MVVVVVESGRGGGIRDGVGVQRAVAVTAVVVKGMGSELVTVVVVVVLVR